MSKCCGDCKVYSSEWFYNGSYNAATGITPEDDGNEVITKLITYVNNSAGISLVQGTGIGLNTVGNTTTITNLAPNQTQVLSISGQVLTLSNGGGNVTIPSVGASQINSDWTSVSGVSQILNKPNLAAYLQTLSYNDTTQVLGISGTNTITIPYKTYYTAGANISVVGGVITNTAPNINQNLSIAGNVISLTSGGSVTLPAQNFVPVVYATTTTLNLASYPNTDTFILPATTTTINLTSAISEPFSREIQFRITGRGSVITLSGASIRSFASTLTTLQATENTYLKIKIGNNGTSTAWELIDEHQIT